MRLSELQALTPRLQAIAERYGASNLAVFGSVARDEATESSDVDLLVDLPAGTSLFQHAELKQDIEDLLQHNVDLIRRRNLKPTLRERVEAEAVLLLPIDDPWSTLEAGLSSFEPGFLMERQQPDEQQRDAIQP